MIPTAVCVLEVAEVVLHSAAPAPACSVATEPTDFVVLDPSTTTAALFAIIVQVVGNHWHTVVTSTAAAP
jgi:hypothetical protein